jgi:hypothetical protein
MSALVAQRRQGHGPPKRFEGAEFIGGELAIDPREDREASESQPHRSSVDRSKPTISGQAKPTISERPRLVSSTSMRPPFASQSGFWCASFSGRT